MSLAFSVLFSHVEDANANCGIQYYHHIHKVASRQWTQCVYAHKTPKTCKDYNFFRLYFFCFFFPFSSLLSFSSFLRVLRLSSLRIKHVQIIHFRQSIWIDKMNIFFYNWEINLFLHCVSLILEQIIAIVSTIITSLRAYSGTLKITFDFFFFCCCLSSSTMTPILIHVLTHSFRGDIFKMIKLLLWHCKSNWKLSTNGLKIFQNI